MNSLFGFYGFFMLNLKFVVLLPSEKCNAKPTNVVLLQ